MFRMTVSVRAAAVLVLRQPRTCCIFAAQRSVFLGCLKMGPHKFGDRAVVEAMILGYNAL